MILTCYLIFLLYMHAVVPIHWDSYCRGLQSDNVACEGTDGSQIMRTTMAAMPNDAPVLW